MEATMDTKMNQAGAKIERILMMHDVIFTSAERWGMIQFFCGLLREVDYKRYQRLMRKGIV